MYLGIDLGTSEVKLLLLSARHEVLATHGEKLTISRPAPGWSEQSPQAWWQATCAAVVALRTQQPAAWRGIRAIGLSGQMHGAVLLDAAGQVLRPAMLWNDTRSAAECTDMMRTMPALTTVAGNLAMPGFTAPKLEWVRRHEPDVFARTAKVLLPKDYLRLCMTGAMVSDLSDASGTLWLDVARRRWSDELLALTGMRAAHMPDLVEGSEVSATLSPEVAASWGLPPGVMVAGGAGDNAASAIGVGAVQPGDGFISLGTSGVLFVATDRFRPNPASAVHAFCHALPGRWHQMTVMLSAASCLAWWSQACRQATPAELLGELERAAPQAMAAAPIFLPYLSGERTPHNDADARGAFIGLTHATTRAALTHAVLEGVAFGMRDGLSALQSAGTEVARLGLVGGGARSDYWAQLHADALGVPVRSFDGGEAGGALGAARLAWLADGGNEAEVCRAPAVRREHLPSSERHQRLTMRHERFRALYQALKGNVVALP
ncbi:MAG: xylulokinase [Rhizobacter sp.]|nr:xylulokinase [Rhizobacter sp.]